MYRRVLTTRVTCFYKTVFRSRLPVDVDVRPGGAGRVPHVGRRRPAAAERLAGLRHVDPADVARVRRPRGLRMRHRGTEGPAGRGVQDGVRSLSGEIGLRRAGDADRPLLSDLR